MSNYQIEWKDNQVYNFNVEFNRIESYNKYVENWLRNYYNLDFEDITLVHKTDWTINDIVDLKDYNRVKNNINILLEKVNRLGYQLSIRDSVNQIFNSTSANEIEQALTQYLEVLGNNQFLYNITNLTTCGNDLKVYGG